MCFFRVYGDGPCTLSRGRSGFREQANRRRAWHGYFRNFNLDLTAGNKFVSARAGTSVDLPWGLSFHTTMCDGAFQVARRVSDHNFGRFCVLDLSAIGLQRLPVDAS